MAGVIIVRQALTSDEAARAEIVRRGFDSYQLEAFKLFFFQELTLQCSVLGGAVLFIFCGVPAPALAALLPALAAALAAAVYLAHLAAAQQQLQKMRQELFGLVAEYRGPMVVAPAPASPPVVVDIELLQQTPDKPMYSMVVGTVSVSECWGPRHSGWLHALAVHPQWRRRGAGRALVAGAGARAGGAGLESLECVASELQTEVRALLHKQGWEVRGWYHRRLAGAALTPMLAQLGRELPRA